MSDTIYIYALCHPESNEIRYIGKTNSLVNRMIQHKYTAYNKKGHFNKWKKKLYDSGLKPLCIVLEEVNKQDWEEAETFWISYFNSFNARLLNLTSGGRGVINLNYTPEIRQAISRSQKGRKHSEETKEKIRKASSQYKHTEETKAKLSLIKSNLSVQTRKNISEAQLKSLLENPDRLKTLVERCVELSKKNKGKPHTKETKLKISNSQKGRPKSLEQVRKFCKLTDDQVKEILYLLAEKVLSKKQIAVMYGVMEQTIYQIDKNINYKWVSRDIIKEVVNE